MKKYLVLFSSFLILTLLVGCNLGNTPTSKVEDLFTKYQVLDKDIITEIDSIIDAENLEETEKERYRKIITKQYKNLSYEIKNEEIDGEEAIVTVEIEVLDYKKSITETEKEYYDNKDYSLKDYTKTKLDNLEKVKDKVIYTLELMVSKDTNGNWKLNALTNADKKKIQGMY